MIEGLERGAHLHWPTMRREDISGRVDEINFLKTARGLLFDPEEIRQHARAFGLTENEIEELSDWDLKVELAARIRNTIPCPPYVLDDVPTVDGYINILIGLKQVESGSGRMRYASFKDQEPHAEFLRNLGFTERD